VDTHLNEVGKQGWGCVEALGKGGGRGGSKRPMLWILPLGSGVLGQWGKFP